MEELTDVEKKRAREEERHNRQMEEARWESDNQRAIADRIHEEERERERFQREQMEAEAEQRHDELVALRERQLQLVEGEYICPHCKRKTLVLDATRCPLCTGQISSDCWTPIKEELQQRRRAEAEAKAELERAAAEKRRQQAIEAEKQRIEWEKSAPEREAKKRVEEIQKCKDDWRKERESDSAILRAALGIGAIAALILGLLFLIGGALWKTGDPGAKFTPLGLGEKVALIIFGLFAFFGAASFIVKRGQTQRKWRPKIRSLPEPEHPETRARWIADEAQARARKRAEVRARLISKLMTAISIVLLATLGVWIFYMVRDSMVKNNELRLAQIEAKRIKLDLYLITSNSMWSEALVVQKGYKVIWSENPSNRVRYSLDGVETVESADVHTVSEGQRISFRSFANENLNIKLEYWPVRQHTNSGVVSKTPVLDAWLGERILTIPANNQTKNVMTIPPRNGGDSILVISGGNWTDLIKIPPGFKCHWEVLDENRRIWYQHSTVQSFQNDSGTGERDGGMFGDSIRFASSTGRDKKIKVGILLSNPQWAKREGVGQ